MILSIARNLPFSIQHPTLIPPVLAITGPRAAGKSHIAQTLFPAHRHTSLALPTEAARALLDPAAFLASLPPPVVIDDVHLAPRLIHHLAREIAARPCPPAGYVLVGSRPRTLAAAVDEAFRGDSSRCGVVEIDGLSHAETDAARPDLSLAGRLLRGGFPALYADPAADGGEFMRSLVAEHLAHELPLQVRVDSVHDYERFLRALAQRAGRLLNKAELAREIGIAGSTAAIWLDTLVDAGVVSLLRPWTPPQGRPPVKAPKAYFRDTGLCAWLVGIRDEQDVADSPHAPMLWETCVFNELRRLVAAAAPGAELAFWRDRTTGADFLAPTPRGLMVADASWSEFPSAAAVARLIRIRDRIGAATVAKLAVVCRTPRRQAFREPGGPAVETVGLDDLPGLLEGDHIRH
jgi:predicted AAA+ superfamily ATPase